MDFELLHNGKNIKDSIKLSRCYSYDRFGGIFDDLTLAFSTEGHTIEFNENDELQVNTPNGFTTGKMYLDSCISNDGKFTIKALSFLNKNKKRKSKIWNQVTLNKIIQDVAQNTGLSPSLYGVNDYTYKSISQINETDLQLLARICKREGNSIKCDDGKLIVFNEYYMEHNNTPITLPKENVVGNYSFNRNLDGLSSMTVWCFDSEKMQNISYTATDDNMSGGEDSKREFLSDINEAERFSKGYLRDANKLHITGLIEMKYNGGISAGTVADLTGYDEFDGRYIVYECMQDFTLEKTTIKVRRTLNY